jgi:methylated-DNA-[protein]-cysteine S-methyltransferase
VKKSNLFFYSFLTTLLGTAVIGWQNDLLAAFVLPQPTPEEAFQYLQSYHLPQHNSFVLETKLPWPDFSDKVNTYFSGKKVEFTEPVIIEQFPDYTRQILDITKNIPWGEVKTYQQVAQLSSRKRAYRAVGQALHRNPIPLIIPCHRVVAKSSLGGFGYGLDWKLRLLTLENIQL